MERFIERLEDGSTRLNITDYGEPPYPVVTNDFVKRLAEYEDTGLTPQEIEQMKARMPLHQWAGESVDKISIFGVPVKKIMEWTEAEKQSRLLILPCKIGDKIYMVVPDLSVDWPDPIEYKVVWDTFKPNDIYEFGKKIFLTREEAEKVAKSK